jgi:hypothetical protein
LVSVACHLARAYRDGIAADTIVIVRKIEGLPACFCITLALFFVPYDLVASAKLSPFLRPVIRVRVVQVRSDLFDILFFDPFEWVDFSRSAQDFRLQLLKGSSPRFHH